MCETKKETITEEKVASVAAIENGYCKDFDCCSCAEEIPEEASVSPAAGCYFCDEAVMDPEYIPDIPEGYSIVETEEGVFMVPDISEEDYATMGFTSMTEEEAEAHRKSFEEYWDSLSDEEIEFLADSAEAVLAGEEEAAACYDQLTEREKLEIFGAPTFYPVAGDNTNEDDGEKETVAYERY